jgi:probable phosphoglycerate mutase
MKTTTSPQASRQLILVRHGATEPNLAGLRCGGDLDAPLTDLGRQQATHAALRIRELGIPVGVIVASHLQRTRETAEIVGRLLDGVEVVIEPAFAERHLGAWNLHPVATTERDLHAGVTPTGGESDAVFVERISAAAQAHLLPRLEQRPLLVGSKGVARALRLLLGLPVRDGLANGELIQIDMSALACRETVGCHA